MTPSMSRRRSSCLAIMRRVKAILKMVSIPSERKQSMILRQDKSKNRVMLLSNVLLNP